MGYRVNLAYFRSRITEYMRLKIVYLLLACIVILGSCDDKGNTNAGKPIILGDPATIVTETDSQYLQDFVADIQINKSAPAQQEAEVKPAGDTASTQQQAEPEQPATAPGNGLTVSFNDVTIFIPGIETRTYTKQDIANEPGASYEITGGKLQGNELKILKGNVDKVSQRYQTVVIAKNELGTLVLESLNELDEWKPVSGKNNIYPIKGLTDRELAYERASKAGIRNAVSRAVKNARMSRSMQNKWISSLKNVKSVKQKPLSVELRSVMWKIDGKDAKGRHFQKQLRIDIPI